MDRRGFFKTAGLAAAAGLPATFSAARAGAATSGPRPNIIIIMADDMGFSDIGCYGGEIHTPNLDRLAARGLRFTQFYNTARCCPTRASLLTGLYPHQAGVGHMTGDYGPEHPGYRGHLNDRCVTIAEVLRTRGYHTAVTGKWHVGAAKREWWPLQRGFDRFYGVPEGGGFYFRPTSGRSVVLDNETLFTHNSGSIPDDWYSTDAWTDYGIRFAEEALDKGQPFFLYLAYNAPHWPLQVPLQDMAKYRGTYLKGWDQLRKERRARMIDMGIVEGKWPLTPRDEKAPAWEDLDGEKKKELDLWMALYAAVVDRMDQGVGRLVTLLEKRNALDNTLILFLSDNGGCAEGGVLGSNPPKAKGLPGSADSFVKYGLAWANASNTPFRLYKHWVHEGGTATPLIAHWPRVIEKRGALTDQPGHVIDLMATCCDVAGAGYPETHKGTAIIPLEGKSLLPIFQGKTRKGHEAIFWEHEGNRAVRKGKWKLVAKRRGPWELFDLQDDRTELKDLAEQKPEMVEDLKALYVAWAKRSQVEPFDTLQKRKTPAKSGNRKKPAKKQ